MKFARLFFIAFLLLAPFFVSALGVDDAISGLVSTGSAAGSGSRDIAVFVGNIIKAVLGLLGILILIFILYGGYLWLASGGNEQMVTKAKGILTSAAIGLIIVLAAMAITTFIMKGVTGAISGSGSTTTNTFVPCSDGINSINPGKSCAEGKVCSGDLCVLAP